MPRIFRDIVLLIIQIKRCAPVNSPIASACSIPLTNVFWMSLTRTTLSVSGTLISVAGACSDTCLTLCVAATARQLSLYESQLYAWHKHRDVLSLCQQHRAQCDRAIRDAFDREKQRYGVPRLTNEWRAQGLRYNKKTVAASFRWQELRAKASHRFSPVSYREHGLLVSDNQFPPFFTRAGGETTCMEQDFGSGSEKYHVLILTEK